MGTFLIKVFFLNYNPGLWITLHLMSRDLIERSRLQKPRSGSRPLGGDTEPPFLVKTTSHLLSLVQVLEHV